jgi:hypothetical protein
VIEIELKKWQERAEDSMQSDCLGHQKVGLTLFGMTSYLLTFVPTFATIVVERLVESYDVNYGARSVINEVQRLAIQLVAESQIRGDIGKK